MSENLSWPFKGFTRILGEEGRRQGNEGQAQAEGKEMAVSVGPLGDSLGCTVYLVWSLPRCSAWLETHRKREAPARREIFLGGGGCRSAYAVTHHSSLVKRDTSPSGWEVRRG